MFVLSVSFLNRTISYQIGRPYASIRALLVLILALLLVLPPALLLVLPPPSSCPGKLGGVPSAAGPRLTRIGLLSACGAVSVGSGAAFAHIRVVADLSSGAQAAGGVPFAPREGFRGAKAGADPV